MFCAGGKWMKFERVSTPLALARRLRSATVEGAWPKKTFEEGIPSRRGLATFYIHALGGRCACSSIALPRPCSVIYDDLQNPYRSEIPFEPRAGQPWGGM